MIQTVSYHYLLVVSQTDSLNYTKHITLRQQVKKPRRILQYVDLIGSNDECGNSEYKVLSPMKIIIPFVKMDSPSQTSLTRNSKHHKEQKSQRQTTYQVIVIIKL